MKTAVKMEPLTAVGIRRQVEQDPSVQVAERRLALAQAKLGELKQELDIQKFKMVDMNRSGDVLVAELLKLVEHGTIDQQNDPIADISAKISSLHQQIGPWERAVRLAENELQAAQQAVVSRIYESERGEHVAILRRQLAKTMELAEELRAEELFCRKYTENGLILGLETFAGLRGLQAAFSPNSGLRSYCDIMVDRKLLTNDDIPLALRAAWAKGGE
jgi:hypothetical protein